ncbi:hypothetical protein HQ576_01635 [bacterium]|nr:hypothetical protein [bacterium]
MAEMYDKKRDRWQRKFKYPWRLRLLFLLPMLLITGVVLFFTLDRVEEVERLARAKFFLEEHTKVRYALYAVVGLFSVWCLYVSFRSWMAYIIVSPSSIKHHIIGHGRQRVSWEHMTNMAYKRRLFGHTLTIYGTDGSDVSFRSSIQRYDELIALIHKNASSTVREQLEALLTDDEDDAWDEDEEWDEDQDHEDGEELAEDDDTSEEPRGDSDRDATPEDDETQE